jgi:hypothetical protein
MNMLRESPTSPAEKFTKEESKILTEYLEAMPLKYPGSKKKANKPSIITP